MLSLGYSDALDAGYSTARLPLYWVTLDLAYYALSVRLSNVAAVWAIGTLAACSLATAGHQKCADFGPVRGRT